MYNWRSVPGYISSLQLDSWVKAIKGIENSYHSMPWRGFASLWGYEFLDVFGEIYHLIYHDYHGSMISGLCFGPSFLTDLQDGHWQIPWASATRVWQMEMKWPSHGWKMWFGYPLEPSWHGHILVMFKLSVLKVYGMTYVMLYEFWRCFNSQSKKNQQKLPPWHLRHLLRPAMSLHPWMPSHVWRVMAAL